MCFTSARIVASAACRQVVGLVVVVVGAAGAGADGVVALVDAGSPAMEETPKRERTSSNVTSSFSGPSSSVSSGSPGAQATPVVSVASAVGAHPVESAWTTVVANRSATVAMMAIASVLTAARPRCRKLPENPVAEEHAQSVPGDRELRDDVV